jgi:hypothetical protein
MGFSKQHKNPLVFGSTENSGSENSDIVLDKNEKPDEDFECYADVAEELTSRQQLPNLEVEVGKPKTKGMLIVMGRHRSRSLPLKRKPFFDFFEEYKVARMKESKLTTKLEMNLKRAE